MKEPNRYNEGLSYGLIFFILLGLCIGAGSFMNGLYDSSPSPRPPLLVAYKGFGHAVSKKNRHAWEDFILICSHSRMHRIKSFANASSECINTADRLYSETVPGIYEPTDPYMQKSRDIKKQIWIFIPNSEEYR